MKSEFNSENSTLRISLLNAARGMLDSATKAARIEQTVMLPMLAMAARAYQAAEALEDPSCVVVDTRRVVDAAIENRDAASVIAEDVRMWEELHMPFYRCVLRTGQYTAVLSHSVNVTDEEKAENGIPLDVAIYNFILFEQTMGKWSMTDTAFQLRSDAPGTLAFDDFFKASTDSAQKEVKLTSDAIASHLYFLLFMLEHNKAKSFDVEVPKSRNTKRMKRDLPPYCDYKVIDLFNGVSSAEKSEHQGGTHSSPKMHIRRGHYRNLHKPTKEGKTKVWVRSSVVGDPTKGITLKEYKA